jgi:hypothetical protein
MVRLAIHRSVEQHIMDLPIQSDDPPIPKGHVRLYRGETDLPHEKTSMRIGSPKIQKSKQS